jgi:hypothetical protein
MFNNLSLGQGLGVGVAGPHLNWLLGWDRRREITVSPTYVDANLTDFPLLVPISSSVLDSGFLSSLRFTDSEGTLIPFEWTGYIDLGYSGAFVKVPTLDATSGATLYMYYAASESSASDPSTVWADYAVAAHFRGFASGQRESANSLALTLGGSASAGSDGVAMNGGYISIGGIGAVQALLSGENGLTYSATCRDLSPGSSVDDYLAADKTSTPNYWFVWSYGTTAWGVHYSPNGDFADSAKVIKTSGMPGGGNDYHFAFTYGCYDGSNPATIELFTNGVSGGTGTSANTDQTLIYGTIAVPEAIGYAQGTSRSINATISEYRIRKGAASSAWLKFEHANLMNTGNEITVGDETGWFPNM